VKRLLVVVTLAAAGCASIPRGRWGVADVRVEGLETLNHEALENCLATRERSQFSIPLGALSEPECGVPPFDGGRTVLDLWAWPFTEWPLFDPSVFSRDQARVERWLRARGYYDGRLTETVVEPPDALRPPSTEGAEGCESESEGCPVSITLRVQEGEPVHIQRIEIHGLEDIDPEIRRGLRESLPFHSGDPFDEALFSSAQEAMLRTLADRSYVDAHVFGNAKIDRARHEAYIAFDVSTGAPAVLGRICVFGNESLPPSPILGATFLDPGQPFSLAGLEEAQRAVYALGVFASVEIRHRPRDAGPPVVSETTESGDDVELRSDGAVPNPEPLTDPEEEADEGEEEVEDGEAEVIEAPSLCSSAYEGDATRVVDVEVHVTPGRLFRLGFGLGWQVGATLSLAATNAAVATNTTASLNQWDFHALFVLEDRNLFGQMLRARFEGRPRIIFPAQFPGGVATPGIQLATTYRWPGFLEPRTALIAGITYDYGPAPLIGFFRHELDGRIGLERTFFLDQRNSLYLAGWVRGNLFFPEGDQGVRANSARESTGVLILQATSYLDLRDNPNDPHEGAFFSVDVQGGGFGGLSKWDYLRVTAEARGYLPLGAGFVLAGRFGIGLMEVFQSYALNPQNAYELAHLGPFSEQLSGGGASSNRGFPAGFLGDVRLNPIEERPTPDGPHPRPSALITGGARRWEASLELRIPITPDVGLVAFVDAGDVARTATFRFDHPQFTFGGGLRLHTIVGTLRLDIGLRPGPLQVLGNDSRPAACPIGTVVTAVTCRPYPQMFGDFGFPIDGAIHFTIGEAF
jgi:hypothetical protein